MDVETELYNICEILGTYIIIRTRDHELSEKHGRFYVDLYGVESKNGVILSSIYANGNTIGEALNNLYANIKGKHLVCDAHLNTRKEILLIGGD